MIVERHTALARQSLIVLVIILAGLVIAGFVGRLGGPSLRQVDQLLLLFGGLTALLAGYILWRKELAPLREGLGRLPVVVLVLSVASLMTVNYGDFRVPDPIIIALLITSFLGTYLRPRRR